MKKSYFTYVDYNKISLFTEEARKDGLIDEIDYLSLKTKLASGVILGENQSSAEIVKLNSIVDLKTPYGEIKSLKIILSGKCSLDENCASIITPLGISLIGSSKGDKVFWKDKSMSFGVQSVRDEQEA